MKRILFLDYDGVVNRKMWKHLNNDWICRCNYPDDNTVNDFQAVQWISEFCQKYEYHIVVSSTWREYPNYADCLRNAGLRDGIQILGSICKSTPCKRDGINRFIALHPEIEAFLVIDDDPSLKCFKNHIVLCDPNWGFGENEFRKAERLHLKFKKL